MSLFFRLHQHLLPRAQAWRIVVAKRLRQFFEGLSEWPADFRTFVDQVWEDLKPETTRELAAWEEQFGIYPSTVEANRRAAVDAEWLANGGQGLDYIQNVLQAVDPSVYVYGPWIDFATELPALRPLLWLRSDDQDATFQLLHPDAATALVYLSADNAAGLVQSGGALVSLANQGTLGGSATPATGPGPVVETVGDNTWLNTAANGGVQFGSTSSLALLHQPGTNATVVFRVRFDPGPSTSGFLLNTRNSTLVAGNVGFRLDLIGSDIRLGISDNAGGLALSLSGGTDLTYGEHVIAVRKTGDLFEILLNGAAYLSGTAVGLSGAAASQRIPSIGSDLADSARFPGAIHHASVYPAALTTGQIADAGATGPFCMSIPNRGTLVGSVTPAAGTGPQRIEVDGKFAALTTTNGGFAFGTTSSLQLLHEPGTNATVILRFRLDTAGTDVALFGTRSFGGTGRGVFLRKTTTDRITMAVGDGSTNQVLVTSVASVPTGQNTVTLRKSGLLFEALLNGTVIASASAASLTSGLQAQVTNIGSGLTDSVALPGAFLEGAVFPYAVGDTKLAQFTEILERWQGGTGFVPRDPRQYVNQPLIGTVQCGEALAQCGEDTAQANAFLANETHYLVNKDLTGNAPPAIPADPATWPFFIYLAGPRGPDDVFFLDETKRRELERQILKIRPLENWIVMRDVGTGYLITDDDGFLSVDDNGFLETT